MSEPEDPKIIFVRVFDRSGREFICPSNALKDPGSVDEDELGHCFDSAEEAFSDAEIMAIIRNDLHKD